MIANEILALLGPPFLVALALVGIHAYFGIQVLARNVVFVDLALAQIAALGTTLAYMLGHGPQTAAGYGYSLLFTLLAALFLAFTRQWSGRISQEALIGVIYVVAAAATAFFLAKNFNLLPAEKFSEEESRRQLEEYRKIQPF